MMASAGIVCLQGPLERENDKLVIWGKLGGKSNNKHIFLVIFSRGETKELLDIEGF